MKIGIFGGTFDPIHNAHLQTAVIAREALKLDKVLMMVSADPPHKSDRSVTPAASRFAMVELAVRGFEGLVACDMEMRRNGKSYTALTLEELHEKHPDDEFFLIIGSDSLQQLPGWYMPERVCSMARIAVIPRVGYMENDVAAAEVLREKFGAVVVFLPEGPPRLSSSEIRESVRNALPLHCSVPLSAERYLYENGLYVSDDVKSTVGRVREIFAEHPKRYQHTMAVVRRAAFLAERYGVDPEKARTASLLHDIAKYLPPDRLEELSREKCEYFPVLHAFAGLALIRDRFGIDDPEILNAVRLHSTGDAAMDKLSMLLFLADMTEDTRDFPGLQEIADAADKGPEIGMFVATEHMLTYLLKKNEPIHPATFRAYQYYKQLFEGGSTMENLTQVQAEQLAKILYDKKAMDIVGIPVAEKTIVAEWFLIASGRSVPQIRALSDEVEEKAAEIGMSLIRKEGYDDARWIVLDYGDILVHIFHPDERKYYSIERLWDTEGTAIGFSEKWEAEDKAAQLEKLKAENAD